MTSKTAVGIISLFQTASEDVEPYFPHRLMEFLRI
jgi:hypothetical protein